MSMQGNYLILKKGKDRVPLILPTGLEHKEALALFHLKRDDVISAGTFSYDPSMFLGGFAFRCESVDIGQVGGARLFGRGDQDACVLRDEFQNRS